jgi:hypothetical protein
VGAAIPAADAGPLGMAVGQTVRLVDGDNQRLAVLRVTGRYRATDQASSYWAHRRLARPGQRRLTGGGEWAAGDRANGG